VTPEELCAALATALGEQPMRGPHVDENGAVPPQLTERELQVLNGMAQGQSNAAIGRELYLSEDTIKTHARRLFRKLGVSDRAQAVASGFRWGLVR
jgi:DNA-binding NarL/FixJ family response regulator